MPKFRMFLGVLVRISQLSCSMRLRMEGATIMTKPRRRPSGKDQKIALLSQANIWLIKALKVFVL